MRKISLNLYKDEKKRRKCFQSFSRWKEKALGRMEEGARGESESTEEREKLSVSDEERREN